MVTQPTVPPGLVITWVTSEADFGSVLVVPIMPWVPPRLIDWNVSPCKLVEKVKQSRLGCTMFDVPPGRGAPVLDETVGFPVAVPFGPIKSPFLVKWLLFQRLCVVVAPSNRPPICRVPLHWTAAVTPEAAAVSSLPELPVMLGDESNQRCALPQ